MRTIPLKELARIVERLGTAEKVADHFRCSLASAHKMIEAARLYQPNGQTEPPDHEIKPLPAPAKLPNYNPAYDPLEWSYEKEKIMMRQGSRDLLLAMLETGQHRLTPEAAEALLRKLWRQ